MISPKHCISPTIEGIDIIYLGKLDIHTVLMYHSTTYDVWPGLLLIFLYLALNPKHLSTPSLERNF